MELPAEVSVHNTIMGMKGNNGTLLQITDSYYEINCRIGTNVHRMLLPIQTTVLISVSPEDTTRQDLEIER